MDIPDYLQNPDPTIVLQENYHSEVNQTLQQTLGPSGWEVTNITDAELRTDPILDPNLGTFTTVQDLKPIGTIWFVTDATPPVMVQKVSENPTELVKFTTTSYP